MTTEEKRIDEEKSSQLDRPEPIPGFPEFGHIPFEGLRNTRDLGGMPTADGRTIAPAKLLRSGALHKASEQDLARLVGDYDLAGVIDFRTQLERDIDLAPLLLLVGQVARNAEVDVDLGAQWYAVQARTHALGIERGVVDVRRNGDASGSDGLAHAFRANALLRGDAAHLLGHDSGTRVVDLRYLIAHGSHGALPSLALPTQVHRVGVTSALSAWITQAPRSWFGIICQIRHGKLARAKFPR